MKPLVIYHANCADGFTAAWAVRQAMECDFHAAVHGEPPPPTEGRDLVLVDFCYPPRVMLDLQLVARSILVLDHHKSAEADMPDNPLTADDQLTVVRIEGFDVDADPTWRQFQGWVGQDKSEGIRKAMIYALFDMDRSGAGIAWDFFHPGQTRPLFLDHVEDRDLWRFELQHTREICAAVHSHPYTFEAWDALAAETAFSLYQQGLVLERARAKDIAEQIAQCRRELVIGNYRVPVASIPRCLVSDAAGQMAKGSAFAACYQDTSAGRKFDLRSTPDGVDVSEVAALYGGGGHARAAGFTVPRDHKLARA